MSSIAGRRASALAAPSRYSFHNANKARVSFRFAHRRWPEGRRLIDFARLKPYRGKGWSPLSPTHSPIPFLDVQERNPCKRRGKDSVPGAKRSPFAGRRKRERHAIPVLDNDRSLHFAGHCCGPPTQTHASLRAVILFAFVGPQKAPSRHRELAGGSTTTFFPPLYR